MSGVTDWLTAAGGLAVILGTSLALVRIAVAAERRRADDWRTAYQTSAATNEVLSTQVNKMIGTTEQLVTSQREMMALIQKIAADRGAS